MKILLDARLYGLEHAGLGRYTQNLVNELSELDKKNKYTVLLRKKYFNTLKLPNNFRKVLFDTRHYGITEQLGLVKIINSENPDLIHSPHYNAPIFTKKVVVTTIHDLLMSKHRGKDATTLTPAMYYFKYFGSKATYLNAIKRSKAIIVPSKAVKRDIVDTYNVDKNKIKVIYEGLGPEYKVSDNKTKVLTKYNLKKQRYLLYVGNTYPHKNIDKVIKAVTLYNNKHNKKLVFAISSSRDIFTNKLREKIEKDNLSKTVKVLGFVPDKQLVYLHKNSLAFIYASLSEGFGLQGLEAMASGNLLLASDIPVFKELYKDNALYFNPLDTNSILLCIENANKINPKERERRIFKAKEFVKKYSWSSMAKETLEVYKKVVK